MRQCSEFTASISCSSKYWDVLCYSGSFLLNHSVPLCSRCTSQPLIRRHDDAILLCCSTKGLAHPFTVSPTHSFNPQKLHIKRYTFPPAISAALLRAYLHMRRCLVMIFTLIQVDRTCLLSICCQLGAHPLPPLYSWKREVLHLFYFSLVSLWRSLVTCVED